MLHVFGCVFIMVFHHNLQFLRRIVMVGLLLFAFFDKSVIKLPQYSFAIFFRPSANKIPSFFYVRKSCQESIIVHPIKNNNRTICFISIKSINFISFFPSFDIDIN